MRISNDDKTETIQVLHFLRSGKTIEVNNVTIPIPINTSTFALAAMLKGLEEYYLKPGLMEPDAEAKVAYEANLEQWNKINADSQPSSIIIP